MFSSKKQKLPEVPGGFPTASSSSGGHVARFQDLKRDGPSRLKHLKLVLESMSETEERRKFLRQYSLEAFHLFHDLLCQADLNPPSASRPGGEVEFSLWTLEQILCYLPDLVSQRWQYYGIGSGLKKCLHPGNVLALRKIAIRLFIMWYETLSLGHSGAPEELDQIFAVLVPYMPLSDGNSSEKLLHERCETPWFSPRSYYIPEAPPYLHKNVPVVPQHPEKSGPALSVSQSSGLLQVYLDKVFDSVVKETPKIEWETSKKCENQRACINFLFEKIKKYYLSVAFPNMERGVDVYNSSVSLPSQSDPVILSPLSPTDPMVLCKYCVVRWMSAYAFSHRNLNDSMTQPDTKFFLTQESPEKQPKSSKLPPMYDAVRSVLLGSLQNVNFTLSVLKEGLLLPMECYGVIGRIFRTLREWIFMDDTPEFMQEPLSGKSPGKDCIQAGTQASLQTAINILCWFYYSPYLVEEKRNVAFQISHKILGLLKDLASPQRAPTVQLSAETWLVLLRCLLRVVEHTLQTTPPSGDAYHFAKGVATSLFQTLLITWVLAGAVCRAPINSESWDELVNTLTERTAWPELIDEWNKVLESVTRALSLNFYQIDLQNPPLERLSEQKMKKQIGASKSRLQQNQMKGDHRRLSSQMSKETYDFCQTVSPGSSLTTASLKSEDKTGSETEFTVSKLDRKIGSDDSPMSLPVSSMNESKKSSESFTPEDSQLGSDAGSGFAANPEVVSLGSVSIDSNSLGLLASEKETGNGEKSGGIFGDRDSMTPSPIPGGAEEGLEEFDEADAEGGDVELTPREEDRLNGMDGSEEIWMIVWRRILGCLGNINEIRDPNVHVKAVSGVGRVAEMLLKVVANQGVSLDGQPPAWPSFTPPSLSLCPWLIGCLELPDRFQKSKVVALEALCHILFSRQDCPLGEEVVAQFYESLHRTAAPGTEEVNLVIVRSVCPQILHHQHVVGTHVLIEDCLNASRSVLESRKSQSEMPQAVSFVAGLASFPGEPGSSWSVLGSDCKGQELRVDSIQEESLHLLVRSLKEMDMQEQPKRAVVNSLSMLVCTRKAVDSLYQESLDVLLGVMMDKKDASLQVCDNLSALLDQTSHGSNEYKDVVVKMLTSYCAVLESGYGDISQKELCQRILADMTEWCLRLPLALLISRCGSDHPNLMHSILGVINLCLQDEGGWLFPCASACHKLLTQSLMQYPLPQFGCAQLGSIEAEKEQTDTSDTTLNHSGVVEYSNDMIWTTSPVRERTADGCKLIARSVMGKHSWVIEENNTEDTCLEERPAVNFWLNAAAKSLHSLEKEQENPVGGNIQRRENSCLGKVCSDLTLTSPEAVPHLNFPNPCDEPVMKHESEIFTAIHQLDLHSPDDFEEGRMKSEKERKKSTLSEWRSILGDLSLVTWNKNAKFSILHKESGRLERELKHVDKIFCRETHKLAVIYVAEGQEDKQSILNNSVGSHLFEEFVSKLGWEIDLSSHPGYTGGLPNEGSTPYYSTPTCEVIFHVSTRLSSSDQTKKLRHLGNDEVHVVWSEHWRDYRRSIIATEFCDVLIVIYPLANKLFRIQVESTNSTGASSFGPLFSGALVKWANLACLIRATAVNASRAKRRTVEGWKHWADQRAAALLTSKKQLGKALPFSGLTTALYTDGKELGKMKLVKTSPISESSDVVMV